MEMPLFVPVPDPSHSQPQVCSFLGARDILPEPLLAILHVDYLPFSTFYLFYEHFALIAQLFVDYPAAIVCQILLFINL